MTSSSSVEAAPRAAVVAWHGAFAARHSLAHVNRELARRLGAASGGALGVRQTERDARVASADVHVTHGWPPALSAPGAGRWIVFQPWEYGSMPAEWLAPFRDQADEVWVYTPWNRDRYVEDGLDPAKVAVVPLGVDATRFRPDAPPSSRVLGATDRAFRFLFVGGTIRRKGVDVLLAAWRRAFRRDDDVALIVKDFCKQGAYKGQTHEARIAEAAADPDAAPIVYLDDDLDDAELAGLYASCHALVHPYRGEGFGLPVLEAMASGLPTLVTRGGACDAFCDASTSLFIGAERRPAQSPIPLVRGGWTLEPSAAQLAGLLRLARSYPDALRDMGLRAREKAAREWTWERAAAVAADRIARLLARD